MEKKKPQFAIANKCINKQTPIICTYFAIICNFIIYLK